MKRWNWFFIIAIGLTINGYAQDFHPVWHQGNLNEIDSYDDDQKIVGTHYFYWYDYPNQHFYDNGEHTDDALQDHFPNPETVSYNSVEWHEKQMADCAEAGIDFVLPVYWGTLDNYFRQGVIFSIRGLGPLQTAIERRERAGKSSPKIGLFYDTSTLLPGIRGVIGNNDKPDLRTAAGKDLFYRTIRDFFYQIHPKHWAAIDGKPIVVLYGSGFAKDHDQSTFDYVYEHFKEDFHGVEPFIIKDNSWRARADATTQWGAALGKPNLFERVAQIGPGYNDSAVPGRNTPIRDREDGDYYRYSWNEVLNNRIRIVLLETWNEMHEGTEICESTEYGRQYIELTREYVDKFKRGERGEDNIELEHPDPLPRPSSDEGKEYKDAKTVSVRLGHQGESKGIWLVKGQPDGPVINARLGEENCIRTPDLSMTYIYFKVADPYYFDEKIKLEVEYTYWDDGFNWHRLQYDSHDRNATLSGAYKDSEMVSCTNKGQWVTKKVTLADARFVNRENGGSDFRFAVAGGWMAIRDVSISKLTVVDQ